VAAVATAAAVAGMLAVVAAAAAVGMEAAAVRVRQSVMAAVARVTSVPDRQYPARLRSRARGAIDL